MDPETIITTLSIFEETKSLLSLNRFHLSKGESPRLAALNALFLDLDFHAKPVWRGSPPHLVREAVILHLDFIGLPLPSIWTHTGRGLAAIWLINELPPEAAERWRGALRALMDCATEFGPDRSCSDSVRVFRLPGTRNEKSGKIVQSYLGTGTRYDFDTLSDQIYVALGRPTRAQLQERRREQESKSTSLGSRAMPRGVTHRERFRVLKEELESFAEMCGGTIPEGWRALWLHFYATCLTYDPDVLDIEEDILRAAQLTTPGLTYREIKPLLRQAVRQSEDPAHRYNYAGSTMAERLDITTADAERAGYRFLVPSELKRAKKREARRARNGAMSRTRWLQLNSAERNKPWEDLGIGKTKYYELKKAGRLAEFAASRPRTGPSPL
ncbi:RepB family DNA primase [Limimaricola litoreus]|nr:RepB family DNA primase [Limimaricola litoreus]